MPLLTQDTTKTSRASFIKRVQHVSAYRSFAQLDGKLVSSRKQTSKRKTRRGASPEARRDAFGQAKCGLPPPKETRRDRPAGVVAVTRLNRRPLNMKHGRRPEKVRVPAQGGETEIAYIALRRCPSNQFLPRRRIARRQSYSRSPVAVAARHRTS